MLNPCLLERSLFGSAFLRHAMRTWWTRQRLGCPVHTSAIHLKMRKTREEKKFKNIIQFKPKSKLPTVQLWKSISAKEIAQQTKRDLDDVLKAVSYVDEAVLRNNRDTKIDDVRILMSVAKYLGFRVEVVKNPFDEVKPEEDSHRDLTRSSPPDTTLLVRRPPVVTIMGHVDHGKTTLLDALRHSSIVEQEHGGITQHIGAFKVELRQGSVSFLDTPGHAAFRAMRSRGAHATDLVVLVVAADDGIMEQTVESIRFAREADVPIIVAINKIDKPVCDIEGVKHSLLTYGIQVEELGGDVQAIPISALKGTNLDQLVEAILTQAEVMAISGDPEGSVEGVVLEASLDTRRGKVSTALVQRGTLKKGCILVAGLSWAKVRAMYDEHGDAVAEVTPGNPVQVIGWKSFPSAGDVILQATSERHARDVLAYRERKRMEARMEDDKEAIRQKLEEHLLKYRGERQARLLKGRHRKERQYFREKENVADTHPRLAIVLKGDVDGSVEAILDVIYTYRSHDACRLDVVHSGVGNVTENDVVMAECFDGQVYMFNTSAPPEIKSLAEESGIVLKSFNVIYRLIEDVRTEISSRLPLVQAEDVLGEATVLQQFTIKEGKKRLPVAGSKCVKGVLKKSALCKVMRSDKMLYNGPIASLRHEKSDVDSVKKDVECGVRVGDPEVNFQPGDTLVCYQPKTVAQVTDWDPGF